jgi:hypothetical protein
MWKHYFSALKTSAALFGLFVSLLGPVARGDEPRLAISGYDPVAYFTEAKPVPGVAEFEYVWHDARWRFATSAHRDLFTGDPDRYAPQYDGYCSNGMRKGKGHKDRVNPEAWVIVDGKLYLMHTMASRESWLENVTEHIKLGDQNWPTVKDMPESK